MLACELDLPIGIDVPLTLLSAILAVFFTFAALASDLLWTAYMRGRRRRRRLLARYGVEDGTTRHPSMTMQGPSSSPLLGHVDEEDADDIDDGDDPELTLSSLGDSERQGYSNVVNDLEEASEAVPDLSQASTRINSSYDYQAVSSDGSFQGKKLPAQFPEPEWANQNRSGLHRRRSSQHSISQRSQSFTSSNLIPYGLGHIINMAYRSTTPAKNAFIATGEALYARCTLKNAIKSFLWSLAITSMHYVGIAALRIPGGHFTLHPFWVILSAMISWIVCLVGCILMSEIETHFTQQFLFAAVACIGVGTMHFTGMSHLLR